MKRAMGIGLSVVLVGAAAGLIAWYAMRSDLGAKAAVAEGLYCDEHGVPERFCTLCHPDLKSTLLLCPEHGNIPEDICVKCHPDVEMKNEIRMCPKGHGLPEHFCIECGAIGSDASTAGTDDGWCATHNRPEEDCDTCRLDPTDEASRACRQTLPTVRLASSRLPDAIGIETAAAVSESHSHELTANAETAFDANRYAEVQPRVGGFLRSVRVDLGDVVEAGQVIAVVDSADVSASKAQYLAATAELTLAQDSHNRIKSLAARNAASAMEEVAAQSGLNRAKAGLWSARQKLKNFRFSDKDLDRIVATEDTSSELPLVAPISGTIVARHAVIGEAVEPTTVIYAIADTKRMWLWIDVYESDFESLRIDQAVTFAISGSDGASFEGSLTWLGAEVDPVTRTTRARAELVNVDGRLRANQFGRAVIRLGEPHEAVVVPRSAVQKTEGGADVVFLPEGDGVFRPQRIVTRASTKGDSMEASWGLKAGDRVVTKGSFWLKTELMRGAIGAGCCE